MLFRLITLVQCRKGQKALGQKASRQKRASHFSGQFSKTIMNALLRLLQTYCSFLFFLAHAAVSGPPSFFVLPRRRRKQQNNQKSQEAMQVISLFCHAKKGKEEGGLHKTAKVAHVFSCLNDIASPKSIRVFCRKSGETIYVQSSLYGN